MSYRVEFTRRAERQFKGLPKQIQLRLTRRIDALADDPFPHGSERLSGGELCRVRAGDYRVIYAVQNEILLVLVVKVGHRRDVYRQLQGTL